MPPKPAPRPQKAVRYWAGRGKEEEQESDSGSDDEQTAKQQLIQHQQQQQQQPQQAHTVYDYNRAATDRRLQRLSAKRADSDTDSDSSEQTSTRRRAASATASANNDNLNKLKQTETENESDDDEAEAQRRARLRMVAQRRAAEAAAANASNANDALNTTANDASEFESESESEYESDSDDNSRNRPLLKPVFIPKAHRETIQERERMEQEERDAELQRLKDLEERKKESHNLVEEELRKEIAAATVNDTIPDVDDTDGINEEEEFELWRLRELNRIKRDRKERDAEEKLLQDIERRRNMTDAEIQEENERLNGGKAEEKKSYKFMQKYYHKGAFFTDEEIVATRDFNEPTLEDKFDKSILPAVMQVKNFGRSGQTKWTHLSKEDTSSKDSAWFQNTDVNKRTLSKMGGMKQSYDKPTVRKRSKLE
ncbi:UNVERIFIED_CONTAM: hypothetical protein HDU68_002307 [Siphonaria sp. JEL0065]|nr:hypothetical protein HDU68_002307 [Siphonaria sp. JEL0065]